MLGRRSGEQQQLPEVWVLLYKVARDMSRAAGAEELVNSFQTAAESYLVVSTAHLDPKLGAWLVLQMLWHGKV